MSNELDPEATTTASQEVEPANDLVTNDGVEAATDPRATVLDSVDNAASSDRTTSKDLLPGYEPYIFTPRVQQALGATTFALLGITSAGLTAIDVMLGTEVIAMKDLPIVRDFPEKVIKRGWHVAALIGASATSRAFRRMGRFVKQPRKKA